MCERFTYIIRTLYIKMYNDLNIWKNIKQWKRQLENRGNNILDQCSQCCNTPKNNLEYTHKLKSGKIFLPILNVA